MNAISIVIIIAVSLAGLVIGLILGTMPMRNDALNEQQRKIQQLLGILGIGLVLVLMIARQDAASWAVIIALALGVAIAVIPPVRSFLRTRFPVFDEERKPGVRRPEKQRTKRR